MKNRLTVASFIALSLALLTLFTSCGGNYQAGRDPYGYYDRSNQFLKKANNLESEISYVVENRLEENEWVNTDEENVSTFSADVDTASYTLFRNLANNGTDINQMIEEYAGWFRTEEFVNYFKYEYEGPQSEDDLFGITKSVFTCPWDASKALLVMGFASDDTVPETNGNNYVFLIDVSGSMASSDKLPLLKSALHTLVSNLGDDDIVSIVTYASKEKVVCKGLSAQDKTKLNNAIDGLKASGSTNGESGMKMAYDIAEKYFIEGGNNRIIMATDGDLNVGFKTTEEIEAFVSEKKASGVYLSVLGFGSGNYRDSILETIADKGNGAYYYVDSEVEAERIFGTDLDSTLYTIAEDVKLQLTFDKDYVEGYRLIGYENRMLNKDDFTDDTKDAGEIGAGHKVTVIYEVKLRLPEGQDVSLADLEIRWKKPGETESNLQSTVVSSSILTTAPTSDAKFAAAVAHAALILRGSEYVVDNGNINDVIETIESCGELDEYREEFVEILNNIAKEYKPVTKTESTIGGVEYY